MQAECQWCGESHRGCGIVAIDGRWLSVCPDCLDTLEQPQERPRYAVGQTLLFNETKVGIVRVADKGGALGVGEHSYDLFVEEEKALYKHVPESKVTALFFLQD